MNRILKTIRTYNRRNRSRESEPRHTSIGQVRARDDHGPGGEADRGDQEPVPEVREGPARGTSLLCARRGCRSRCGWSTGAGQGTSGLRRSGKSVTLSDRRPPQRLGEWDYCTCVAQFDHDQEHEPWCGAQGWFERERGKP